MKYSSAFICCLLMLCKIVIAQTPAPPVKPIVEYSVPTATLSGRVPFDQQFSIKINNIPAGTIWIKLRIIKHKRGVDTPVDSARWERQSASEITTIKDFEMLSPNTSYRIEFSSGTSRNLTNAEENQLKINLAADINIENAINSLAGDFITAYDLHLRFPAAHPNAPAYGDVLNAASARLAQLIDAAVKKTDSRYKMASSNAVSQLNALTTYIDRLEDIVSITNSLSRNVAVTALPAAVAANNNLIAAIRQTNWARLTAGDVNVVALKAWISAIGASFGAVPAGIQLNLTTVSTAIDDIVTEKERFKTMLIDQVIVPNIVVETVLISTNNPDFVEGSKSYMSVDLGVAAVAGMDRGLTYTSLNIYMRPINKSASLNSFHGWDWWAVRTSFLLGMTLASVEKENVRKGLFGNKALVLGIGFRVIPHIKINGGALWLYRYDTNPLFTPDRYHNSLSPFASISFDVDVKSAFTGILDFFAK
jgi:hypothetical protein